MNIKRGSEALGENTSSLQSNHPLVIILYLPIASINDIFALLFVYPPMTTMGMIGSHEEMNVRYHVGGSSPALYKHAVCLRDFHERND